MESIPAITSFGPATEKINIQKLQANEITGYKMSEENRLANEIKGFISCCKNQQPRRSHVSSHANVNFSSKTVANRVTKLSDIL